MSCSICYTEPNKTIICCSCYIETCQDCFISNIKSKIGISDMKQAFSGDNVKCLGVNCHESFQLPTLFKIMDDDKFIDFYEQYSRCKKYIIEYDTIEEHKRMERLKKEEEEKRSALQKLIKHVLDNIFTLKCPNCSITFTEFTGCYALECATCSIHFCAWCLKYNTKKSADNHSHVLSCSKNISKDRSSYFAPIEEFKVSNTLRIKNMLNDFKKDPLFLDMIKDKDVSTCMTEYDLMLDKTTSTVADKMDIAIRDMKLGIEHLKLKFKEDMETKLDSQIKDFDFLLSQPDALSLYDTIEKDDNLFVLHGKRIKHEREKRELERIRKQKIKTDLEPIKKFLKRFITDNPKCQSKTSEFYTKTNILYEVVTELFNDGTSKHNITFENFMKSWDEMLNDTSRQDISVNWLIREYNKYYTDKHDQYPGKRVFCSMCGHYGKHNRRNCPVPVRFNPNMFNVQNNITNELQSYYEIYFE